MLRVSSSLAPPCVPPFPFLLSPPLLASPLLSSAALCCPSAWWQREKLLCSAVPRWALGKLQGPSEAGLCAWATATSQWQAAARALRRSQSLLAAGGTDCACGTRTCWPLARSAEQPPTPPVFAHPRKWRAHRGSSSSPSLALSCPALPPRLPVAPLAGSERRRPPLAPLSESRSLPHALSEP
jgi:hypothetical protein